MNTIAYSRHDPEGIKLVSKPQPSANRSNHILCKVAYAGLNPVDVKFLVGDKLPSWSWCQGLGRWAVDGRTVGFDFAGTVIGVPDGHEKFKVGDEVFGTMPPGSGSFCEVISAPLDQVALKPASLSLREAAVLPLVGLTSVQALRHDCGLKSGQHLLLIGASGGVGHVALQVAKATGATVTAVCSGRNADLVRSLGADRIVDYTAAGDDGLAGALRKAAEEAGRPYDMCFDTVTSSEDRDNTLNYMDMLVGGGGGGGEGEGEGDAPLLTGRYITIGGPLSDWVRAGVRRVAGVDLFGSGPHYHFWVRFPNSVSALEELAGLVDKGGVRPRVAEEAAVGDVEGVRRLFERVRSRRVVGKCVVRVAGPEAAAAAAAAAAEGAGGGK